MSAFTPVRPLPTPRHPITTVPRTAARNKQLKRTRDRCNCRVFTTLARLASCRGAYTGINNFPRGKRNAPAEVSIKIKDDFSISYSRKLIHTRSGVIDGRVSLGRRRRRTQIGPSIFLFIICRRINGLWRITIDRTALPLPFHLYVLLYSL